jgi:hypothetical protein
MRLIDGTAIAERLASDAAGATKSDLAKGTECERDETPQHERWRHCEAHHRKRSREKKQREVDRVWFSYHDDPS